MVSLRFRSTAITCVHATMPVRSTSSSLVLPPLAPPPSSTPSSFDCDVARFCADCDTCSGLAADADDAASEPLSQTRPPSANTWRCAKNTRASCKSQLNRKSCSLSSQENSKDARQSADVAYARTRSQSDESGTWDKSQVYEALFVNKCAPVPSAPPSAWRRSQ